MYIRLRYLNAVAIYRTTGGCTTRCVQGCNCWSEARVAWHFANWSITVGEVIRAITRACDLTIHHVLSTQARTLQLTQSEYLFPLYSESTGKSELHSPRRSYINLPLKFGCGVTLCFYALYHGDLGGPEFFSKPDWNLSKS